MAKQTIKKFELQKSTELSPDILPVIQNLATQGFTLADIGMFLGFAGKDPEGWIRRLQEKYPDIKEALQVGKSAADMELIRTAFNEAVGYWIEEEEVTQQKIQNPTDPTKTKWVDKWKKNKKRFVAPNAVLLFKLLCSRLPEYFSDIRKIEVDKKIMELKGNIDDEILEFAGALGEAVRRKKIESKIVETE